MRQNSLSLVHPEIVRRYLLGCQAFENEHPGMKIIQVETLRSDQQQMAYFAIGRKLINGIWVVTEPKKVVTNSQLGKSWHKYGCAIDSAFSGPDPYLKKLQETQAEMIWEDLGIAMEDQGGGGLKWGGRFSHPKDLDHVEDSFGLTLDDAAQLFKASGIKGVWNKINAILHCGAEIVS